MISYLDILRSTDDIKIGHTLMELETNHEWITTNEFPNLFTQLDLLLTNPKHVVSTLDVFEAIDKYPEKCFSKVFNTFCNDWLINRVHADVMEDLISILIEHGLYDEVLVSECIKRDKLNKNHSYVNMMFNNDSDKLIEYIWKRGYSPMIVLEEGEQQKAWLNYAKPFFPKRKKWTQQLTAKYSN